MDLSLFHFAQPAWLWGLAAIPVMLALYRLLYRKTATPRRLESFADKHLLPHLIRSKKTAGQRLWPQLTVWSLAIACGVVALAGPQWRYTDTQVFKPENDLVVLLDLSGSMNAADVKPTRLARAREEISDLLDLNHGLTIGLVAYAALPHMVVPLTDDMNTIRALLPSLDTGLITIDGDRLQPAVKMAAKMLGAEPGHDKAILVISDGDFTDTDIAGLVNAADGARIYTMGVGTAAGAPIPIAGGWVKDPAKDSILIDPLHAGRLQALSAAGSGGYVEAGYDTGDTRSLLRQIGSAADTTKMAGKTIRAWDEGFYVPALIVALLLLPWFRRRAGFLLVLGALLLPSYRAQAAPADWFRNPAQQGQAAFATGDFAAAMTKFTDPYQQGVAAYKAGQYDKATALFRTAQASQPGPAAEYNLGNAQLMQSQPAAAIKSYEDVLKRTPNDTDAQHNLEIAQKMLAQKQQEPPKPKDDKQDKPDKQNPGRQNGGKPGEQGKDGEQKDKGQQQAGDNGTPAQDQNGQSPAAPGEPKTPQPGQNGQTPAASPPPPAQPGQGGQQQGRQPEPRQNDQQKGQQPAQQGQAQPSATQDKDTQPAGQHPVGAGAHDTGPQGSQPEQAAAAAGNAHQLTQRDLDANQWLNHIQSDPGTFLKNQFMIEEQENRPAQGSSAP